MAIPSLADEIRAYIETGHSHYQGLGEEATLDYALRRWAKRAAALAQIRDELLQTASRANKYQRALRYAMVLTTFLGYALQNRPKDTEAVRYWAEEVHKVIVEALIDASAEAGECS